MVQEASRVSEVGPFCTHVLQGPGEIVLLSVMIDHPANLELPGATNIMPVEWHSQIGYNPTQYMVGVSKRRHTHHMLSRATHFSVAFIDHDWAEKVVETGGCTGAHVDKFSKFAIACNYWRLPETGNPKAVLLEDVRRQIVLEKTGEFTPAEGSHTLFVGRVVMDDPITCSRIDRCYAYGKDPVTKMYHFVRPRWIECLRK